MSKMLHKGNFKRYLTDLNLEFSFSSTSCLTTDKEASLSFCLHTATWRS